MLISLIITTYNRPDALNAVLLALLQQTDSAFEIIIADDGSTQKTADLIHGFQRKKQLLIQHIWQVDNGFQAAKIRNKGILAAMGDYLIFLDGDCVPRPCFIAKHRKLAAAGYFISGNRSLFSKNYTSDFLTHSLSVGTFHWWSYGLLRLQGKINRWFPLFFLPMGCFRRAHPNRWRGVKTCNLAVWKSDLITINGFDESYTGWGYEDSDLVIRLIRSGVKHKSGRFATTVLHLWHPENSRSQEKANLLRLDAIQKNSMIIAKQGLQ